MNKQTDLNCHDDFKYYSTEVYPPQPPYAEFICMYSFLFG